MNPVEPYQVTKTNNFILLSSGQVLKTFCYDFFLFPVYL